MLGIQRQLKSSPSPALMDSTVEKAGKKGISIQYKNYSKRFSSLEIGYTKGGLTVIAEKTLEQDFYENIVL